MKIFKRCEPDKKNEVVEETKAVLQHNEDLFNQGKASNEDLIEKLKENGFHITIWQAAGGKKIKKGSA